MVKRNFEVVGSIICAKKQKAKPKTKASQMWPKKAVRNKRESDEH